MNDNEIKPLYIPESSGNALPDLSKHGAHNETPIPLHRTRTEPSRAMSDSPQKYLLPTGPELRDIIRRRIESQPMSAPALWASLNYGYQTRPRQEQSVIDAVAGMLTDGELEQRGCELHVAEPEPEPAVAEIPAEMWTMTQTARLLSVLGTEPRTRAWLAARTGLKPKQVSKAMNHLIGQGKAEVVGDVPRTWRRKVQHGNAKRIIDEALSNSPTESKMDADDVCKAVLERLGDKVYPADNVVIEIIRQSGWPHDEAVTLLHDMLAAGYLTRQPDGTLRQPKTEPETAVLTEEQTRDVLLERVSGVCDTDVVVADVMRLSGWDEADVRRLIDDLGTEGELIGMEGAVHKPLVKSEDPPEYEIGDDDDGEIPEPGVGRPGTPAYVLDSATIDFVRRDSGGHVADECSVTIDAAGLSFGGGDVMPFDAIDAVMPTLRRVHRALFGDGN